MDNYNCILPVPASSSSLSTPISLSNPLSPISLTPYLTVRQMNSLPYLHNPFYWSVLAYYPISCCSCHSCREFCCVLQGHAQNWGLNLTETGNLSLNLLDEHTLVVGHTLDLPLIEYISLYKILQPRSRRQSFTPGTWQTLHRASVWTLLVLKQDCQLTGCYPGFRESCFRLHHDSTHLGQEEAQHSPCMAL